MATRTRPFCCITFLHVLPTDSSFTWASVNVLQFTMDVAVEKNLGRRIFLSGMDTG